MLAAMTPILKSGAIAALTTTATLALLGWAHERRAAAPLNAVSHILYGEEAKRRSRPSARYTLSGVVLNAAATTLWAALQRLVFARKPITGRPTARGMARALARGAVVSGVAY